MDIDGEFTSVGRREGADLALTAMILSDASAHERAAITERAELPSQIVAYESELEAKPPEHNARRERLAWQLRRAQKRLAEVEARLDW